MFNIVIKRQAKKKLQSLSVATRNRIAGSISMLGYNPDDKRLDVKKLSGREGYRLRVGQ